MMLHSFFRPASVAVIGASAVPGKSGHQVVRNLVTLKYDGRIYPINPKAKEILELPCYPTIAACPETPDIAVIIVPRQAVPAALEETGRRGVRRAIIASGGFLDTGDEEGLALDAQVRRIAAQYDIRYMGPNSIGTVDTHSGFITSITHNDPLPAGPVSFFGQTGLFTSGHTRWIADAHPFGVAKIACLGNKNNVDEIDLLHYLADDAETAVVGCYLEGSRDGRELLAAAARVAAKKPLIVLKGGTGEIGAKAAAGHTGALAGDAVVFAGAMRQAGAIAAHHLNDLFDLLACFGAGRRPAGRRVGLVSITGAGGVLGADAADRHGLSLPELSAATISRIRASLPAWASVHNPVDIWSTIEQLGVETAYREIGLAVVEDPSVDMVVLTITLFPGSVFEIGPIIAAMREVAPDKPVVTVLIGGAAAETRDWTRAAAAAGAATFPDVARAMRTLGALADYYLPESLQ